MSKKKTQENTEALIPKVPYDVSIGDRIYPDHPPKLKKGQQLRTLIVDSEPYLVDDSWRVMLTDPMDTSWSSEIPMDGFHVVGKTRKREARKPSDKPNLVKGDVVQLLHCPDYPSIETHTATITGDPYLAFGVWKAPIKYYCIHDKTAIYNCSNMAFIRHAIIKTSFWKDLYNKVKGRYMKLSKPAIITAIALGVLVIIGFVFAGNYNDLVQSKNKVENSSAKIDTELTRRYDLIDNIVQAVQGSQAQESDVFGKIAAARKIGGSTDDPTKQAEANNTIDTQIALLPRLQETYPELRSNDQVSKLITELQGTNNTIRDVRNMYNDTVTQYNNKVSSFPKNVFAGLFGYDKAKLFEASAKEKVNPKVELDREKN